jgi:RimJ/RimL family protein N-acetyltransferase
MLIKGKMVTLRALEHEDADALNTWCNDPELWQLLAGWHFPYSRRSTHAWIESLNDNNPNRQVFGIEDESSRLIGTANLVNIDWKNRNALHGLMIGDKSDRGKGHARDVVMALMRYAFDELGLNRLDGDLISSNNVSLNFIVKKCGWEIEGTQRNWFHRRGRYYDKILIGITAEKYRSDLELSSYWDTP